MTQSSFRRQICNNKPPVWLTCTAVFGGKQHRACQYLHPSRQWPLVAAAGDWPVVTPTVPLHCHCPTLAAKSHSSFKMWIFLRCGSIYLSLSTASHTRDTLAFLDNRLPARRACVRELTLSSSVCSGLTTTSAGGGASSLLLVMGVSRNEPKRKKSTTEQYEEMRKQQ